MIFTLTMAARFPVSIVNKLADKIFKKSQNSNKIIETLCSEKMALLKNES